MKKIAIILFIINTLSQMPKAFADVFYINALNKNVSMGKLTKIGRVSIFIISAPSYCPPCRELEKRLVLEKDSFPVRVDIYHVTVDSNDPSLKKDRDSFRMLKNLDQAIKVLPMIFIYSPTGNLATSIAGYDEQKYERIKKITAQLLEVSEGINFLTLCITDLPENSNSNQDITQVNNPIEQKTIIHDTVFNTGSLPTNKPNPIGTKNVSNLIDIEIFQNKVFKTISFNIPAGVCSIAINDENILVIELKGKYGYKPISVDAILPEEVFSKTETIISLDKTKIVYSTRPGFTINSVKKQKHGWIKIKYSSPKNVEVK